MRSRISFIIVFLLLIARDLFPQSTQPLFFSDSLFSRFEKQLYSLNPENGEFIPVYFVQLDDLSAHLDTFTGKSKKTDLNNLSLQKRIQQARNYFDSIQPIILEKMRHIDLVFYEEALKARSNADTNKAISLFIKSLQHNPGYGPSAYELIRLSLTPGRYIDNTQYFENYAAKIDSSGNPYYYNLIHNMIPAVLDNIIAGSNVFITAGLPSDALEALKLADYFHAAHPSPEGSQKIKNAYSAAHTGMYQSLITIADRALSARKHELAQYYYQKAGDYQQQHAGFIVSNELSASGLIKAGQLAQVKDSPVPKKLTRKKHHGRKHISRPVSRHKGRKILDVKQKPEKQEDTLTRFYLKKADTCFRQGKYPESLGWCDSSMRINQLKRAIADSLIIKKYQSAAKRIILDTVYAAYFLAWKNNLDKAGRILQMGKDYQLKYFLSRDDDVNDVLKELENRIKDRKCFTAVSDYEASVYRALSRFIRSDFLEGRDFLQNAGKILENNQECGISDTLLRKTYQQYQGLIHWQEHWQESKQALSVKNYPQFYQEYDSAYRVYQSEKLINKGLIMRSIIDYLEQLNDQDAIGSVTGYCLDNNSLTESWALLNLLKTGNAPRSDWEALLVKTGVGLAKDDAKNNDTRWLQHLKSGGKWYKMAKKAYFRTLKTLRSNPPTVKNK